MRKLFVFLMILAAFVYGGVTTTEHANTTTRVVFESNPGGIAVVYGGQTTTKSVAGLDSLGDDITKAMYIGDCKSGNAYFTMKAYNSARGTEDYNVYVYYSDDLVTWRVGSAASGKIYDQLTTTEVTDTLNVIVGARDLNFDSHQWMKILFDAQAGNPVGTYVTWRVALLKSPLIVNHNVAKVVSTP